MNKAYYAIIPANVRYDKELTPTARLLYGEITALCNEKGYCWASNNYFAELYGVSTKSVSKWINQLVKKGYIYSKMTYKDNTKAIEERRLYIAPPPIEEKFNTYGRKVLGGMEEKFQGGMEEKFQDNNKGSNNTDNIYVKIQERYNHSCKDMPTVIKMTDARRKQIDSRLKEFDLDTILKVIDLAGNSEFLCGKKSDWKANFDWIMKPTNFIKILEGNYNKTKQDTNKNESAFEGMTFI